MPYDDEIDRDVDDIIFQIKNQGKSLKNVEKEYPNLQKEDLEKFVIDNASAVVADSIEMIQSLKLDVTGGADAKMVEAVSELVKATTAAIESLAKLKIADDKLRGQKEIKQMEISSRIEDVGTAQTGLFISREELLKHIMKRPDPAPVAVPVIAIVDV